MLTGDHLDHRPTSPRPVVPIRSHQDPWASTRRSIVRSAVRLETTVETHSTPRRIDTVLEAGVILVALLGSIAVIAASVFLGQSVLSWSRSADVAAEAQAVRDTVVGAGVDCDGWVPGRSQMVLGVMNSAEGRCIVPGTGVALRFESYVRSYLDGDNQAGFPPGSTGECPWLESPGLLVYPVMAEHTERAQWAATTGEVRNDTMAQVQSAVGGTLHPC